VIGLNVDEVGSEVGVGAPSGLSVSEGLEGSPNGRTLTLFDDSAKGC
jgi:hypothetical protein